MFTLTIEGRLPSLNQYIAACRVKGIVGANFIKSVEEELIPLFKSQTKFRGINEKCWIDYVFYEANQKRDLDNIASFAHKVVQDSLVKAGILHDDGWQQIAGFSDIFRVDKEHPRIEIVVLMQADRGGK